MLSVGLTGDFDPNIKAHIAISEDCASAGKMMPGEARVIELPSHPFFIATLYQLERSAFTQKVHPLIRAYLQAIS